MPGLQNLSKNNFSLISILIFLFGVQIFGCKTSESIPKGLKESDSRKELLTKYEKNFRPADYDVTLDILGTIEKKQHYESGRRYALVPAIPETIPGFRIQLFLTQDIDEASRVRDSVDQKLQDYWVYVVYDLPYYKVRVGDFIDRPSTNLILKKLVEYGYKDAWVVPDYVLKNPPSKPIDIFIEPQNPVNQY